MSYDLAVFKAAAAMDAAQAAAVYQRIAAGPEDGAAVSELVSTAALGEFYRTLVATYPELDDVSDDDEDASPFSCALEVTPRWVIMNIVFSRADELVAYVEKTARALGLDCFNPQENALRRADDPDAVPRASPPPRLKPREGLARFVAGIDPPLAALGFARAKGRAGAGPMWARTTRAGVVHAIRLNLGTRDVRIDVVFGTPEAAALVAHVRPDERAPMPAHLLEVLLFRGFLPGLPWHERSVADPRRTDFEHSICHDECVEASIRIFPGAIERCALPLFAEMDTPARLDALLSRVEPFEAPRPNWGGFAFWERGWNVVPSFLYRLAHAKLVRGEVDAVHIATEMREQLAQWQKAGAAWYSPALASQVEALASLDPARVAAPKKHARPKR